MTLVDTFKAARRVSTPLIGAAVGILLTYG